MLKNVSKIQNTDQEQVQPRNQELSLLLFSREILVTSVACTSQRRGLGTRERWLWKHVT